ncbi:MAG: amino acid adenylation domain-containing protein, partial [Acidobacteriota bacterium]
PRTGRGDGPVPASYAQQRLWLLDRLQPGGAAYNMPFAYRLRGPLDRAALEGALADLVDRHESLRTVFEERDGQPFQRILSDADAGPGLRYHDLSGLPPRRRHREAERIREAAVAAPFDLAAGPLVRVVLVRLAEDRHELVLNVHHVVFDGWSLGVFWRELRELYAARRSGADARLGDRSERPTQYGDFALWQRERLVGEELEGHLAYWRRRLSGDLPVLDLPTDRARPSQPRNRGAVAEATLPITLADALRRLARRRDASLFMVLLAGYKVLLSRLAGQDDVLVGTPAAGRTIAELEGVIGFFVNTLVVRTDLAGEPSFEAVVDRVREAVLGATDHQEVPFEKLLEEIQPERHLSRSPLFQVFFNMIDLPEERADLEGLEIAEVPLRFHASKFDFTLYAESTPDGVHLQLVYDADLFEPPRMAELLRQYEVLLGSLAAEPEAPVTRPSLVTGAAAGVLPDPRRPLPDGWADWRGAVHEALRRGAREWGDRVAVSDRVGALSYAELERRANRIAHRLIASGLTPGERVALVARRDASLPVALYGVFKAGGAASILDPAYPGARLGQLIDRLAPRAVVVPAEGPEPELPAGVEILRLPRRGSAAERDFPLGERSDAPEVEVGPDDPALVTFTSGSTGEPKGVVGRHGPLTHFLPWMSERFGLGSGDRFSMLSALSHDPLQRDLFTPAWLGATLVVPDGERLGEPGWPAAWAARERVTVAGLTPAMLQLLNRPPETGATGSTGPNDPTDPKGAPARFTLDSLRRAFVVGDVLTRADVAGLAEIAPEARCINLYGSTETQRSLGFHEVEPAGERKEVLPLGRGIGGVQLLVLRDSGELAGIGEPGEVWVRSHHLAAGYLGDPELTAERFVVNPLVRDGGAGPGGDRLYRTGDLGRYRPDGVVEMIGRRDGQVKIRGFRIETGEVASVLGRHPEISECTVVARDDLPGGRGLVAYAVPAGRTSPGPRRLRDFLIERLPDYMVPRAFVLVERLPLTATGKVDRAALPPVAGEHLAAAGADRGDAPLEGPIEELLGSLWAELLGLDRIGDRGRDRDRIRRDDDFFALGGHSLLATRLLSRIRKVLGVEVPLSALFEAPTVAGLARRIEGLERGGALPSIERLPEGDRGGRLPLSWAQERVWFLDRLEDGLSAAYNVTVGVRLTGELSAGRLARALAAVVARHEALRCRFGVDEDGHPHQVIGAPEPVALPVEDVTGLAPDRRAGEVRRLLDTLGSRPFDLARGPLLRALLVRVGPGSEPTPDEHVLGLCLHHIATDGWSFAVLFRELSAFYAAHAATDAAGGDAAPDPSSLPELPIQYPDFAAWQRSWLQGPVLDEQLEFWRELVGDAPTVLDLPTDRPRPAEQGFHGARSHLILPAELTGRLQALCRAAGATPFMVLLTAYGALLGRTAGVEDLLIGAPVANRRHREVEDLIGFFANTLALRVDLRPLPGPGSESEPGPDGPSFLDALERFRRAAVGGFGHQDLPFERLVDSLDVDRDLSRSPLTQVAFAFQNAPGDDLELAGVSAREEPLGGTKSQLDLNLQMRDVEGGAIEAVLEYATDLFDRTTAERLLARFQGLLEAVLDDPARSVRDLPVLTAAERETVLHAWNATGRPIPEPATIHGLVRAVGERDPDRPAVRGTDGERTYGELLAASARLARHLIDLGAGAERPVGVLLERSAGMVAALLGVLEAGAAYLPLDPAYPDERLALMVEDAGVDLVVTEESLLDPASGPLTAAGARAVVIDGADREAIGRRPAEPPARARTTPPDGLAYLIYTSGSTGRPKGVEVPHRAAANFLASMARVPGLSAGDELLSTTTISFDISVLELFLPLTVGARVTVVDRETAADGRALAERLDGIGVMQATPTTWRLLLESGWNGAPALKALSGGEPLDRELADRLSGAVGELWNVYGPTETTVWSTLDRVGRVDPNGSPAVRGAGISIGRPIANTAVYVVDPRLRPVPPGSVGELLIGGAGVTRGYRGRPGVTAERFVPDAFVQGDGGEGARLYRTGDLARWWPDGRLECLGRTDHQVKVRGHRIEPGEIESRLAEHPAVARAVVVARGSSPVRLVAYLVAEPEAGEPTVLELRSHLSEDLPDYMVPAAFVFLAELPTTPNGKVDREALPEPGGDSPGRAVLGEEYVPPETEAERALAEVWCRVLDLERAGAKDNFFALGGDSILGIQVVTRMAQTGWHLAVRDLFRHQTLGELAATAVRAAPPEGRSEEVAETRPPERPRPDAPAEGV